MNRVVQRFLADEDRKLYVEPTPSPPILGDSHTSVEFRGQAVEKNGSGACGSGIRSEW